MPRIADPRSEKRLGLLAAAERLFAERGYAAVKLRDIADAASLHHASIYHYFPGGKEQIYVDVMSASFHEHRRGLTDAIASARGGVREQLHAVADWFTSHPPVDAGRMTFADLPALAPDVAEQMARLAYDSLRQPIVAALRSTRPDDPDALDIRDADLAAMALVSLIQSAHTVPAQYLTGADQRAALGRDLVDMLIDGWAARPRA